MFALPAQQNEINLLVDSATKTGLLSELWGIAISVKCDIYNITGNWASVFLLCPDNTTII